MTKKFLLICLFIGLLTGTVFFFINKNSAKDNLTECLKITGTEFKGTSESGSVTGDAFIQVAENGNSCSVEYSLLNSSAFENGKLTNLELKEKKSNNTYKIIGDWEVEGGSSYGAKFIFEVFDDVSPNTILCQVSGGNWAHYSNLELSDENFIKVKKILSIDKSNITKYTGDNWEDYLKSDKPINYSNTNVMIGKFINYEYIENDEFTFKDEKGKEFYFYDIPEKSIIWGKNGVDTTLYNKKFKITWVPEVIENDYTVNKILSLELIDKR